MHVAFSYALIRVSPAWRGFLQAADITRTEAFIRKAVRFNFCSPSNPPLVDILDKRDFKFFQSVISNANHPLYPLLPAKTAHRYNLRARPHNFILPPKRSALGTCNFLIRMLYKDCC